MTARNILDFLNCKNYNDFAVTDEKMVENFFRKMLDFLGWVIYYNINIIFRQDAR